MEGIRDGDVHAALEKYVGERYVQHSTGVLDGRSGFSAFFESFLERNPDQDIRVVRVCHRGRPDRRPGQATDLEHTEANEQTVADFIATVLRDGRFDRIEQFVSSRSCIQHDPEIPDGAEGLVAYASAPAAGSRRLEYRKVHHLVGQGDSVATLSETVRDGVSSAVFDIFRLGDGLIVEHGNVTELIPEPEQVANGGKF
ncbi:nuclear transport factor 2 family protein [Streptomyces melanogenes]|uniref:nuclear transport factor 2 family protein n=1 Tax=Streptomyces melanogenes TaxID=67326 RepID=UPI00167EFECD|nr:nuclear transport factor 2 family protein [Streptomyces melanogenes]GGP95148.1 polyketide cyclase [Streptomyces melanogenes]